MNGSSKKLKKQGRLLTEEKFYKAIGFLAAKEEIAKLATKEEIKKLVTKEEIKKLATKEEIAKLATKEELRQLERRLRSEIRITAGELEERLDGKSRLYRDQILNVMNDFLEEIKASREERTIVGGQVSRNARRLDNHEKRLMTLEKQTASAV